MHERKPTGINKERLKAKTRERYKNSSSVRTESIFPKFLLDDHSEKRVAIYLRTAIDNKQQDVSCEFLKSHYSTIVSQHPNWKLVETYADKGVSGSSTKNHTSFNKMIADCEAGKIDLIITRDVSRFSRNIVEVISYVKRLRDLNPPVGVFFESENLYSLNKEHIFTLAIIEAISLEESKKRSEAMKRSYESRRQRGLL